MCYGPCIQYLWCAQTCSRRPRWSCDLEVIWSWTYCYEALKEVSWMVCIIKSLAMGLLWSVCDMLRNHETPDISNIYDCSIGCYLWDYCATNSFRACISEPHRSMFVNVCKEMDYAVMFEMDACCAMFFCQNLKRHCDLLSRRWNEHCLSYMKPLQLRLSHLHYALYSVPDLSPYQLER